MYGLKAVPFRETLQVWENAPQRLKPSSARKIMAWLKPCPSSSVVIHAEGPSSGVYRGPFQRPEIWVSGGAEVGNGCGLGRNRERMRPIFSPTRSEAYIRSPAVRPGRT